MKIRYAVITVIAAAAIGCSTPQAPNENVATGGGSAASSPSPRQEAVNVATPTPVSTARTDETADGTAEFEGTAGITDKKNPNATGAAVMADVRSARHGNYDRVVFEFLGGELPSYHIEYIDKPVRACGSGNVVPFAGDAWLSVRFTGAQAHAPEGDATIPMKDRTQSPNLPIVKDLKLICDFEAEVEWVMGVSSPNRYRVIELEDPTRLVVDIKHNRQ